MDGKKKKLAREDHRGVPTVNTKHKKSVFSLILLGIFWIYTGVFIFIINIGTQGLSSDLTQVYFLVSSLYLILGYLFAKIKKIYFFIGLVFFIFLLGGILRDALSTQVFLRWFIVVIIGVFGITTLILGFRKKKKPRSKKSYIVTGILLIFLAFVAIFSMRESISFSRLLITFTPLLLVMWGTLNIREALLNKKVSEKEDAPVSQKEEKNTIAKKVAPKKTKPSDANTSGTSSSETKANDTKENSKIKQAEQELKDTASDTVSDDPTKLIQELSDIPTINNVSTTNREHTEEKP